MNSDARPRSTPESSRSRVLRWIRDSVRSGTLAPGDAVPSSKAHSPEQELVVAGYGPKALVALQMEGVARAFWFILGAYSERGGAKNWGMLRRDGTAKPVFAALATLSRELGGARLMGELDAGGRGPSRSGRARR